MIIGLAGKAGSGKDTVADMIVDHFKFEKLAFADNLKHMCMEAFSLSEDQCYNQDYKEQPFQFPLEVKIKNITEFITCLRIRGVIVSQHMEREITDCLLDKPFVTPRELLQYVGSEVMRDCIHPDIHAQLLGSQITMQNIPNAIIADARFPNERDIIKSWGGVNILVNRDLDDEKGITGHVSENSLGSNTDYDYVIDNRGTLVHLKEIAIDTLDKVWRGHGLN